jgi:twitching motility protein PilT
LPRADGQGRIPAVEVLVNTERVFDRIVDPKQTHTLPEVIADGAYYGMQTFDQAIMNLYEKGMVDFQTALAHASEPTDFKLMAQNRGLMAS